MSLVEVARFANGIDGEIVRTRLESDGIMSFCFDQGINIFEGAGLIFPVRLMVIPEDLEAARAILIESGTLDADGVQR